MKLDVVVAGGVVSLRQHVADFLTIVAPYILDGDAIVEVHLVTDRIMAKNVLSYQSPTHFPYPDRGSRMLGEIYLNPKFIKKHGQDFDVMALHGFLHLLGYDHETEGDRLIMEQLETKLLRLYHQQFHFHATRPRP